MQPAYWPWAGLIDRINQADVFIWMDSYTYSKNENINRNQIKTKNGAQYITVPVLHKHNSHTPIKDIEIDNKKRWAHKHFQSIKQSYSKCPYWTRYEPFLSDLYAKSHTSLSELNFYILEWILDELNIATKIVKMSDGNFQGNKSELILDMCLQLGATEFVFGINGKDYADIKLFFDADVKISFQDYLCKSYVQPHGDFLPYMSTLDVMMCKGPNSMEVIRG